MWIWVCNLDIWVWKFILSFRVRFFFFNFKIWWLEFVIFCEVLYLNWVWCFFKSCFLVVWFCMVFFKVEVFFFVFVLSCVCVWVRFWSCFLVYFIVWVIFLSFFLVFLMLVLIFCSSSFSIFLYWFKVNSLSVVFIMFYCCVGVEDKKFVVFFLFSIIVLMYVL